ncbi:MAG: NAD(P)/FAD-dependent oxidoreductase [bacterium]|nr:NAD(P)/FAD-dependent oxidoreductase [bacterium]
MKPDVAVLIIGAGPAGMTAAMQLRRAGIELLIVEKDRIGGALLNAGLVENYPGFPGGISGLNLVNIFRTQLCDYLDVGIESAAVISIDRKEDRLIINSTAGELTAQYVVVATGATPLKLHIPGEAEGRGEYVFHEIRDLKARENDSVCIVGGGDVAYDYALSLSRIGCKVTLAMRSSVSHCLRLLQDRVADNGGISVLFNRIPARFDRIDRQTHTSFDDKHQRPVVSDYVLIAIGRESSLPDIAPDVLNWQGGPSPLYRAGDVINGSFRQVGIAVGDGLHCAMDISRRVTE